MSDRRLVRAIVGLTLSVGTYPIAGTPQNAEDACDYCNPRAIVHIQQDDRPTEPVRNVPVSNLTAAVTGGPQIFRSPSEDSDD